LYYIPSALDFTCNGVPVRRESGVKVDVGPHPNSAGLAGWCTPGPDWPSSTTWLSRDPANVLLEKAAQERLARYIARRDAARSGEPTLNVDQLDDLIGRTRAALNKTADPIVRSVLVTQLDDMRRETEWRKFLNEDQTNWPAEPAEDPAEAVEEPSRM
jgi:hypothetical protein